jgi:DNA polymerase II large subunit
MDVHIKKSSVVLSTVGTFVQYRTFYENFYNHKCELTFKLDNFGKMELSVSNFDVSNDLQLNLKKSAIINIEIPRFTEEELRIKSERKQKISNLKADIEKMQSDLKMLEIVDRKRNLYEY